MKCENTLLGRSPEACPILNYYILSYFFEVAGPYMGFILIGLGGFLVILGVRFIKITVFIICALTVVSLTLMAFYMFSTGHSTTTLWILFGVSLVLGIGIGFFIIKIINIFYMILGGYMGYMIGMFVYNLVLIYLKFDQKIAYWVIILICIAVGALLSLWIIKMMLIGATSIVGGYGVIRGASLYLGHFPDENKIMDLVSRGEWSQFDKEFDGFFYAYLGSWVLLVLLGIFVQGKTNSEKTNDDYRKIN